MTKFKRVPTYLFLLPVMAFSAWAAKTEFDVPQEKQIERRRVSIMQTTRSAGAPSVLLEEVEYSPARTFRLDQKTQELITQLEQLSKRAGQKERVGELKMRLAELYFYRAESTAVRESQNWEKAVQAWETLPEAERSKKARPVLKTPQADALRKAALIVYMDLERQSRGSDKGKSLMIRRDEVLYYYGSTLGALGRARESIKPLEELVNDYPRHERIFAARLALAETYFDFRQFDKASTQYLQIAAGKDKVPEDGGHLRVYALYKLAWCYMNTAQFPKAVQALQRTLELSRRESSERRIVFERESLSDLARAFALADQFKEGDAFFDKEPGDNDEYRKLYWRNAADSARDRQKYDLAYKYYQKLIEADPKAPEVWDLAREQMNLRAKESDPAAYVKLLAQFAERVGHGSDWWNARSSEEQTQFESELVALLRREAKFFHKNAQVKKSPTLYKTARAFYENYFRFVPEPNKDSKENVHEMRFFQAELLYYLADYKAAAEAYARVSQEDPQGKYASSADYAHVVALQDAAKKDKGLTDEVKKAVDAFVAKYPKDERVAELRYAGAAAALKSGDSEESMQALRDLVRDFPGERRGVDAAERILYLDDKEKNFAAVVQDSEAFLANAPLMKAGGAEFRKRLEETRLRARFKVTESLPEGSASEHAAKAQAYGELAKLAGGELKEKAVNNALFHAQKSENADLVRVAQNDVVKASPNSASAQDIFLKQADDLAQEGSFEEALAKYNAVLKNNPKLANRDKILWNRIFIRLHLEEVAYPELSPMRDMSRDLAAELREYLDKYARGEQRGAALGALVMRKGATAAELKSLEGKGLDREQRQILDEAKIVIAYRSKAERDYAAMLKTHKPDPKRKAYLKDALAFMRFQQIEKDYVAYTKSKLNYDMKKFAGSLKGKLDTLAKLEKEYLSVVSYASGEWALQSLERLAQLYQTAADDIKKAPGIGTEELKPFFGPLEQKAEGFLRTCVSTAAELRIGGPGLSLCRAALAQRGAFEAPFTLEQLPAPSWTVAKPEGSKLLDRAADAFAKQRWGHFTLARELLLLKAQELTPEQRAYLDLNGALYFARRGRVATANELFRRVSEMAGGETKAAREAAMKNLAALALEVGDFAAVPTLVEASAGSDVDAALMTGLAYRGLRNFDAAISAYQRGLSSQSKNARLLINMALAQGAAKDFKAASKTLERFISLEAPPASHPSRRLYNEWSKK